MRSLSSSVLSTSSRNTTCCRGPRTGSGEVGKEHSGVDEAEDLAEDRNHLVRTPVHGDERGSPEKQEHPVGQQVGRPGQAVVQDQVLGQTDDEKKKCQSKKPARVAVISRLEVDAIGGRELG